MTTVETTSETNGITSRRRGSVHKNLFDPTLYEIPREPKGMYQPARVGRRSNTTRRDDSIMDILIKTKNKIITAIPAEYKTELLPDVNMKITSLCLIWYVSSSVSSNLSKKILHEYPHPIALTELQFLVSGVLCLMFATLVNYYRSPNLKHTNFASSLNNFPSGILPPYLDGNFQRSIVDTFLTPSRLILMTTFPLGIFQFVGHIMTHKAVALIPISLVHSVKALSPIMTVAYYRVFNNKNYNPITYYTLGLLISGVLITCWSTSSNSTKKGKAIQNGNKFFGLFFAFISMMIFVTQNIFAKGILTYQVKQSGILPSSKSENDKRHDKEDHSPLQIDKITILFYCSCIGFLLTLGPFLTSELIQGSGMIRDLTGSVFFLVSIHGITHFFQAMLAFQLIGLLSSVNYSVANIMKRIVIIVVALFWESKLNFMQFIGLALTVIGLYGYDKWGISKK